MAKSTYRMRIERMEREIITEALQRQSFNVSATARELGMARGLLYYKMRVLGIELEPVRAQVREL